MLCKRKPHGGVKQFCKGVALSSFLTAVLAGFSTPSLAELLKYEGINTSGDYGTENDDLLINGPETTSSKGIEVKGTINVTGKDVKIVVNDSGKNEEYGIYSLGSNNLTINSDSLLIDVDSVGGLATRGANGLYVNNAGTINLRSNQDIKFDVTAKDVIGYGIRTYGSGNYTTLDARGNIDFTVSVENTLFNRDVKSSGITNDGNHIYDPVTTVLTANGFLKFSLWLLQEGEKRAHE